SRFVLGKRIERSLSLLYPFRFRNSGLNVSSLPSANPFGVLSPGVTALPLTITEDPRIRLSSFSVGTYFELNKSVLTKPASLHNSDGSLPEMAQQLCETTPSGRSKLLSGATRSGFMSDAALTSSAHNFWVL